MYLEIWTSQFEAPGRRKGFFPTFPNVKELNRTGLFAPFTLLGSKAVALNQLLHPVAVPQAVLVYGVPAAQGSPAGPRAVQTVPRSLPIPVPDSSTPWRTVNGRPLEAETMPLNS